MSTVPIFQTGKLRPREVGSRRGGQPPEPPTRVPARAPPRRLTWVVHTCLDDIVQGEAGRSLLVPQFLVQLRGQRLGHVVVVLGEVRVLLLRLVVQLELVVGVTERHGGGVGGLVGRVGVGKVISQPAETSKGTEQGFGLREA